MVTSSVLLDSEGGQGRTRALRLLRARPSATDIQLGIALVAFIVILGACYLGPTIANLPGPDTVSVSNLGAFSPGHLFGTDEVGRDVLSRVLYGGRVSIQVSFASVGIGFIIGGALGLMAGYGGGILDTIISRFLDMLLAFPALVLALAVAAYLGPSQPHEILALAFFTVPGYGRYARGVVLPLRSSGFLAAGQLLGAKRPYMLVRHVFPNVAGTLLTFGLVSVSGTMLAEAGLSYLGAGVRPPTPSWGNMIAEGQQYLSNAPHILVVPAIFLCITILSVNVIGDALRTRFES